MDITGIHFLKESHSLPMKRNILLIEILVLSGHFSYIYYALNLKLTWSFRVKNSGKTTILIHKQCQLKLHIAI